MGLKSVPAGLLLSRFGSLREKVRVGGSNLPSNPTTSYADLPGTFMGATGLEPALYPRDPAKERTGKALTVRRWRSATPCGGEIPPGAWSLDESVAAHDTVARALSRARPQRLRVLQATNARRRCWWIVRFAALRLASPMANSRFHHRSIAGTSGTASLSRNSRRRCCLGRRRFPCADPAAGPDNTDRYLQRRYGSDGTRTRDLRRDRPVLALAG
jgi:hypothetical protein